MNVIFGAGGFAREVGWLMDEIARHNGGVRGIDAFVASDNAPNIGRKIHGSDVISESRFFDQYNRRPLNIYIAVGSPSLRKRLHEKCTRELIDPEYPSLVHPSVKLDLRDGAVAVGAGVIVCAGTALTTDIRIGDFCHLNLNCTIGHDAMIGAFSTLSPGVHISGGVSLGEGCFVGTGAVLLENVRTPAWTIIGASATVVKTLDQAGTYIGTPAKLKT